MSKSNSSFFRGTGLRERFQWFPEAQETQQWACHSPGNVICTSKASLNLLGKSYDFRCFGQRVLFPRLLKVHVTATGPASILYIGLLLLSILFVCFFCFPPISLSRDIRWPLSVALIFPATSRNHRCKGKSRKLPKWSISPMVIFSSRGCWEKGKRAWKHFKIQRNIPKSDALIIEWYKGKNRHSRHSEIQASKINK